MNPLLFEIYRLSQLFSNYPSGIYVISNNLEGIIPLNESGNEEVYFSYMLFSKARSENEILLNDHKGVLRLNWLRFRIEAVVNESIPESEWTHLDLEF